MDKYVPARCDGLVMFDEVAAVHVPLVRRRVPSLKFEIAGVWSPSIADVIHHALRCPAVTLAVDVQSCVRWLQPVGAVFPPLH